MNCAVDYLVGGFRGRSPLDKEVKSESLNNNREREKIQIEDRYSLVIGVSVTDKK